MLWQRWLQCCELSPEHHQHQCEFLFRNASYCLSLLDAFRGLVGGLFLVDVGVERMLASTILLTRRISPWLFRCLLISWDSFSPSPWRSNKWRNSGWRSHPVSDHSRVDQQSAAWIQSLTVSLPWRDHSNYKNCMQ